VLGIILALFLIGVSSHAGRLGRRAQVVNCSNRVSTNPVFNRPVATAVDVLRPWARRLRGRVNRTVMRLPT
jgi:hypothetical protein